LSTRCSKPLTVCEKLQAYVDLCLSKPVRHIAMGNKPRILG